MQQYLPIVAAALVGIAGGITLSMFWPDPAPRASLWGRTVVPEPPPRPTAPSTLEHFANELGERLRLATEIADAAARGEIESYCAPEMLGTRKWYDTLAVSPGAPEIEAGVDRALRYLELRTRLFRHPQQKHLVRFDR